MASLVELALVWGRDCVLEADAVERDVVAWKLERDGWPPHVTPIAFVAKLDAPARFAAGSDLVVSATPTEPLASPARCEWGFSPVLAGALAVAAALHVAVLAIFWCAPPPTSPSVRIEELEGRPVMARLAATAAPPRPPPWLGSTPVEFGRPDPWLSRVGPRRCFHGCSIGPPRVLTVRDVLGRDRATSDAATVLRAFMGDPLGLAWSGCFTWHEPPSCPLNAFCGSNLGPDLGSFGFRGLSLRPGPQAGDVGHRDVCVHGDGDCRSTGPPGVGRVPRVRTDDARVVGALSRERVRRAVRRHLNEVRFCYEQEFASRPDLAGRVTVAFSVSPTGSVSSASVASTTLNNARVESCIVGAVRRWTFPAPDGGGVVGVDYPFVLESAE